LLPSFRYAYAGDGPSSSKKSPSYQLGSRLEIGWKKRQKSVSLSSGGCPLRKNGSDLTRLKVMDVKSLVTLGLGGLQERQENVLHGLEGDVAKKCPIHKSHHTLQECQKFEGMSTSEKESRK